MMIHRVFLSVVACVFLALGALACGDDDSPESTQTAQSGASGASGATGSTGAGETESEAALVEERAAGYAECLRAAGVNGVEESEGFPQVSFPAGPFDLVATFLESPEDAARAAKPGSPSLYGESFSSTVLSTDAGYSDVVEGPPPKADRRLALNCLAEIGA